MPHPVRLQDHCFREIGVAEETQTWHYGLVARWWAEFNESGPEIALFRRYIDEYGDPVLDTGCGTGRLLVPYLQSGLQVDGADASVELLDWCQQKLDEEALETNLYAQPMHQLDIPRKYQTIINCGAFGLGGDRENDLEGLRRVYHHLNPGGVFLVDWYLPNFGEGSWKRWLPGHESDFPRPFRQADERKTASDGTELEISSRQLNFDPLQQTYLAEIKIDHYRESNLIASETSQLTGNIYFMNEIILMLRYAGFENIRVRSASTNEEPKPWQDRYIIFIAEKP